MQLNLCQHTYKSKNEDLRLIFREAFFFLNTEKARSYLNNEKDTFNVMNDCTPNKVLWKRRYNLSRTGDDIL